MEKDFIEEDLKIVPGTGAAMHVGSDAYAYYVSEVLSNGVVGLYQPHAFWDSTHPWEGGVQVVQDYNPECKTETFIKRRYGRWWVVGSNGKAVKPFTGRWSRLVFGKAWSYRDPSF